MPEIQKKIVWILLIGLCISMLATIYAAVLFAPPISSGFFAPDAQRIFYLHMPSAISSYIAFIVIFIASILYLKTSNQKWDIIALSSAEIALVFCTVTLITGALWGKAEWDKYWRWEDLRLVTYLILWLILCAYLGLRNSITEPEKRARLASVFGIIGFVGVPMSYFSMYIWRTLHPVVVSPGGGGLNEQMRTALIMAFITMLLLYSYILHKRIVIEELEHKIEEMKESMEGDENG